MPCVGSVAGILYIDGQAVLLTVNMEIIVKLGLLLYYSRHGVQIPVRIARKARLSYDDFLYISHQPVRNWACAADPKSAGCLSCLPTPI